MEPTAEEEAPRIAPPLGNLAKALAKCLADIKKNPAPAGHNKHFNYKFVSIAQVTDIVRPLLGKHGVMMFTSVIGSTTEPAGKQHLTRVRIACTFVHGESGESFLSIFQGEALDTSDKGLNKAYTAALKQCLLKTFLLADGEADPDGDTVTGPKKADKKAPKKASDESASAKKAWATANRMLRAVLAEEVDTDQAEAFLAAYKRMGGVDSLTVVPPSKLSALAKKLKNADDRAGAIQKMIDGFPPEPPTDDPGSDDPGPSFDDPPVFQDEDIPF